jgi:uncharacterized protein (DUF488 family)
VAAEILTIGHSTHEIERFLALLRSAGIETVADVRRYPGSRRNPQFGAARLADALGGAGVAFEPLGEELGGRRRPRKESANGGWQVEGFRAYADHMQEPGFEAGIRRLEQIASSRRTAVMCAEADWHRCHRRLIADALRTRGWRVLHIGPDGGLAPHEMTPFAVVERERISYPPAQDTLTG